MDNREEILNNISDMLEVGETQAIKDYIKDILDALEVTANSIRDCLDIQDLEDLSDFKTAFRLADDLSDLLY